LTSLTHRLLMTTILVVISGGLFSGCGGPPDLAVMPARDLFNRGMDQIDNNQKKGNWL